MKTFWTTSELHRRGRTDHHIRLAITNGSMIPVRRGLYAVPNTPAPLLRAARVGGVATATTAALQLGIWAAPDLVPGSEDNRLHFAFRRTTTRLHDPDRSGCPLAARDGVVLHPADRELVDTASASGLASPLMLVEHGFRSLPPEHALAMLDSALHLRFLDARDLPALAARLPARLRPVVGAADARADSGIETIARYLLRLAGLAVVVHPVLEGIGEVDLLVEGRLIVELDGRRFHDDEEAFARDRARDLAAAQTRYRVLRFTWRQVLYRWPSVEAAVFAALAA